MFVFEKGSYFVNVLQPESELFILLRGRITDVSSHPTVNIFYNFNPDFSLITLRSKFYIKDLHCNILPKSLSLVAFVQILRAFPYRYLGKKREFIFSFPISYICFCSLATVLAKPGRTILDIFPTVEILGIFLPCFQTDTDSPHKT